MKSRTIKLKSFSASDPCEITDGFTKKPLPPIQYDPMLLQIVHAFGFTAKEYAQLLEQQFLKNDSKNFQCYEQNRVEQAKRLVRQCVYKISSRIFNQSESATSFSGEGMPFNSNLTAQLVKIPITFRTVYILFHIIGFNEKELAYILNISIVQVRERLARAAAMIPNRA
jgi:hypothetical protein